MDGNIKSFKVLHIVPYYYPAFNFGGPVASIHYLNKELVNQGIDVTVFTTDIGIEGKVDTERQVLIDGVRVNYFKHSKRLSFLSASGWNFSYSLIKALKERLNEFDVVHISEVWSYSAAFASYYCSKFKKPYIISPRGSLYPYTFKKKIWKKLPYYYLVLKRILKKASIIQYVTHDEKNLSHNFLKLKNNAIVIQSGIDFSEFDNLPAKEEIRNKFPILNNKIIILFLSRINWIKGLDNLIESFNKLLKTRDDLHLLIVGEDLGDGYKEVVQGWIRNYGIENNVTFTGMLKGRDKLAAYTGSDIFILPSYSENFGMVVIEAMACGIPTVISDKVGLSSYVKEKDAGIITENKVEKIVEALEKLVDSNELRKIYVEKGKKFAQDYNIKNVAEMMTRAYQSIMTK